VGRLGFWVVAAVILVGAAFAGYRVMVARQARQIGASAEIPGKLRQLGLPVEGRPVPMRADRQRVLLALGGEVLTGFVTGATAR
jgi:outer membrane lipoprotein SlyB